MARFNISPTMIKWTADKNNLSVIDLAKQLNVKDIDQFINGTVNKKLANQLMKKGDIPFGFLFLRNPPVIVRPKIPDLRQTTNALPLSSNFYENLEDIRNKQEWYRGYLKEIGAYERLNFVGKYDISSKVNDVAVSIKETINLNKYNFHKTAKQNYFKFLVEQFENIGILVFQSGIVKSNTRKPLDINEFRGFAISDKYIPVIFINSRDSHNAKLFTLLHEVAHIWTGIDGVSDWKIDNKTETFCNKVAAEFLMPATEVIKIWDKKKPIDDNLLLMTNKFKVSKLAAMIQAKILKLADNEILEELIDERKRKAKNNIGGGGDFYHTLPLRNSKTVINAMINEVYGRRLLLRDAANYLHTKPTTIMNFHKRNAP